MSTRARVWISGVAVMAVAVSLHLGRQSVAGEEKGARDGILKIAADLEKGDAAAAKSQAKALAGKVEDIEDVMNLMKLRSKKGLGVGKKGTIVPDGIELKLQALERDAPSPSAAQKEAPALEEMAYRVAAIAEVAVFKAPKDQNAKKQKEWVNYAKALREAAPALAEAAKSKSPVEIQKAAKKIDTACNNCHTDFK